ncbi:hypothetical protein [Marinospirillum perlucidum]|uniref:hypothetical protein n=1 Tax=Marinospirillum perlucidum TaxID=1982602 RepID=UPI000DF20B82|nr:hypothetical protein [Marinospirillum perlucidum]
MLDRLISESAHRYVLETAVEPRPPRWYPYSLPDEMRDAAYSAYPFSICGLVYHGEESEERFAFFSRMASTAYQLELRLQEDLTFSPRTYLTHKIRLARKRQYEQNAILVPMMEALLEKTPHKLQISYSPWMQALFRESLEPYQQMRTAYQETLQQGVGLREACQASWEYLPGRSRLVIYRHPSSLEQALKGTARADLMDDFEARLLRSRVDAALKRRDLKAAQTAWQQLIHFEVHYTRRHQRLFPSLHEWMLFVDTFELDRQQTSEMMLETLEGLYISDQSHLRLREKMEQKLSTWMQSSPPLALMPLPLQWQNCFQDQTNCKELQWP